MLGFEVEKFSKALMNTSNTVKTIKSNIRCIEAPMRDDPII